MKPANRGAAVLAGTALFGGILTACGGGRGVARGGSNAVLTASTNATGPFSRAFNPFLPTAASASGFADNVIYEPLMMKVFTKGAEQPWLATSDKWSDGGKTLSLTLRSGIKCRTASPFRRRTWPTRSSS